METKKTTANCKIFQSFRKLDKSTIVDCTTNGNGRSGGLAFMWNSLTIHIDIIHTDSNYIDFILTCLTTNNVMRAIDIYGFPQHHNKFLTSQLISDISTINYHEN